MSGKSKKVKTCTASKLLRSMGARDLPSSSRFFLSLSNFGSSIFVLLLLSLFLFSIEPRCLISADALHTISLIVSHSLPSTFLTLGHLIDS